MQVSTINANAFRNSVFFSLSLSQKFGNRAKVKDEGKLQQYLALYNAKDGEQPQVNSSIEGGTRATSTTKVLLPVCEPLDKLREFMYRTKEDICGRFGIANPSKIKEGLYVVGNGMIDEIESRLKKANQRLRDEYIPALIADYPEAKQRAKDMPVKKGGLGPLYDDNDYPEAEDLAKAFGFDWQWMALGIPDDLPEALKREQQEKMEKKFSEAAEEIAVALRASFQELIAHATEKLTPSDDGKPKVFRDSMIENIQAFIDVFAARNIMNDAELAELVNRAQDVLIGIDVKKVRKDEAMRTTVKQGFDEIKAKLDTLVETRKSRRFDFSDDTAAAA